MAIIIIIGEWEWVMVLVSDQPGGCISLKTLFISAFLPFPTRRL
jgi:hypothetical protein